MVKPQRVVSHKDQSYPATCPAIVASDAGEPFLYKACGAKLLLLVTRSPLETSDYLIVERCPEHLSHIQQVLRYEPINVEDDDDCA